MPSTTHTFLFDNMAGGARGRGPGSIPANLICTPGALPRALLASPSSPRVLSEGVHFLLPVRYTLGCVPVEEDKKIKINTSV